jgi:hypothetical protein
MTRTNKVGRCVEQFELQNITYTIQNCKVKLLQAKTP